MYFDMKDTGRRIRLLRTSRKITQEKLSQDLHITDGHLRKLEAGTKGASVELFVDIAFYFEVSLDYLILGKEQPDIEEVKQKVTDAINVLTMCVEKL